jgi:cell division ATPase FtsA
VVTISAYSNRTIRHHSTSATATAMVIEVMAHGLKTSQPGAPPSAAARPPIQNQPGG